VLFRYSPEGADPQEWDFQPGKLLSPESEAIEKVTGLYLPAWQEAAVEGSQRALRAFLWVMLKRLQPTLKFEQVVVAADEMELVFTDDEIADVLAEIHKERVKGTLNEDQSQAAETFAAMYEERHGTPWAPSESTDEVEGEDPKAE
jgi:hypothetical protein